MSRPALPSLLSFLAAAVSLAAFLPAQGGTIPVKLNRVADALDPAAGAGLARAGRAPAPTPAAAAVKPAVMKGWPVVIPTQASFHPKRNLVFADLDGDGRMEIIRSNTDGKIYVWRCDGTTVPGWPRQLTYGWGQDLPTVADLDGDGTPEIIVPTRGMTSGGGIEVLRANGTSVPGWPKSINGNNISGSITAADLDGDGALELIAQERAYPVGYVHVFRLMGQPFPGKWPFKLDHVPTGTPTVGDVDGDGRPEIVVLSYNSIYLLDAAGAVEKGWPYDVSSQYQANFSYQSPALGDLTGDGKLEIATCCHKTGSGCYIFTAAGALLTGWPKSFGGSWSYSPPTLVDLDGDGRLDVLAGRAGGTAASATLYAWDRQGTLFTGFPVSQPGGAEAPLTVADIDLDGRPEIFFDSNILDTTSGNGWLHCVDDQGRVEPGFPLRPPGFTHMNGATLGDVDGDGILELGVVSFNQTTGTVTLWKLVNPGSTLPGPIHWKCYHEGNAHRGLERESDRLAVTGHITPGGILRIELRGEQGWPGAAFLGLTTARIPLPPFGVLRLDPTRTILPFLTTVFGSSGRHYATFPVPNQSVLLGAQLPFQGFDFDPKAARATLRQMRSLRVR